MRSESWIFIRKSEPCRPRLTSLSGFVILTQVPFFNSRYLKVSVGAYKIQFPFLYLIST